MSINWNNIRSFNNSQNNAFEEFVCQLAREEQISNAEKFLRVGAPDGGVEAYWILNNGEKHGWQAKFFHSMGDSQWQQLEKSFKTAFEKRPQLVKYYICIPLDRQDPKIEKQKWFMDKWNDKVDEWTEYAKKKGRIIEFEYWGSSELIHRISEEKHAGRFKFWFNEEHFSDDWFSERLDRSIADLDKRYTPELNFDLAIAKTFDGIGRNDGFKRQYIEYYDDLLKKAVKAQSSFRLEEINEFKEEIEDCLQALKIEFEAIDFEEVQPIEFEKTLDLCAELRKNISGSITKLYDLKRDLEEKNKKHSDKHREFSNVTYYIDQFGYSLIDFIEFLESETTALVNLPVLILEGEAGIGKSHLLADIAIKRRERGQCSLLLLGQHFTSEDNPWVQIIRNQLLLNCSELEFLGALQTKAQSTGRRLIVFIDAINEGKGRLFWPEHIKSFIRAFSKYKWLGLVLSVRSSYTGLLTSREKIGDEIAVRLTHHGFAGVEYEASKKFFENYNIKQPSIPLLHPEFQNPLFLKLFCDGLEKAGYSSIPEGYEGITKIIDFYLNAINERICVPTILDYSKTINLVKKAAIAIAQKIVDDDKRYVSYEVAYDILESILKKYSNKCDLLDELISEGLFAQNRFWLGKGKFEEGIYIAYERFGDHLTVEYLLETHMDKTSPETSFSEGQVLNKYIRDEHACYMNEGIVEAISIRLPELIGKELYEIAKHCETFYPVAEAFVKSLIWRKTETITEKVVDYVEKNVLSYKGTYELFFDTLLLITSNPKHYFNADSLHNHLMKFSMADRDAQWTIYINDRFSDDSPIKRLVDWAWTGEDKSPYSDEAMRLTAKTIAWFFTSSNRFLRDASTKALVALLENRIKVLIQVLREFEGVNDPYVFERLYAIAYGCAVRTRDKKTLKQLSQYVYEVIFDKEEIYPHILLRDYARGIIEYTVYLGFDLEVDFKKIRPPYKSVWPQSIPSDEDIKSYNLDYESDDFKDYYWAQKSIISSMQTEGSGYYGDFGRYVFQSGFSNWSDLNPMELSRIAIKRIFDLGYDVEKHGEYDRRVNSHGREGRKSERIGKKYQWIAFYELLAKASDKFLMAEPSSWREKKLIPYQGPWEPYVRDIDPTILISKTATDKFNDEIKYWWFKASYSNWAPDHKDWLKETSDLPAPAGMIEVKDSFGEEWLVLQSYPEWAEPDKIGVDRWDNPHKRIWYQIRSYLVKSSEYDSLITWAKEQNFMGTRIPESREQYELFSREYFWSPGIKAFKTPYYGGVTWQEMNEPETNKCIAKVSVTVEGYFWEEGYDCSKKEGVISFFKPSELLFTNLGMKYGEVEGELLDQDNKLICFDPSVMNKTLPCLLIRKKELLEFLENNDLKIFWNVRGEKQILGGYPTKNDGFRMLEISGAYYLNEDSIIDGYLKTNLR